MNDVLPDGRNLDLLNYPFDQYQRYEDVSQVVEAIRGEAASTRFRILDVGGTNLSQRFLARDRVTPINLEHTAGALLSGNGTCLPFADHSFDLIITVDTLEHVPQLKRAAFLAELLRVAARGVIITGPFASGLNEASEQVLLQYITQVLGHPHRFLSEHAEHGLPSLDECLHIVNQHGARTLVVPSGYIQHWLPLMIIRHGLLETSRGRSLAAELDGLYNATSYWRDHRLPSYRQVLVALYAEFAPALAAVQQTFQQAAQAAPDLNGVLALWQGVRWQTMLQEHEEELRRLDADRRQLQAENARLAQLVARYESGRFIRFMAKLKQPRRAGS